MTAADDREIAILKERVGNQAERMRELEAEVRHLKARMETDAKAETAQLRAALIFLGSILLSVLGYLWFARNNLP